MIHGVDLAPDRGRAAVHRARIGAEQIQGEARRRAMRPEILRLREQMVIDLSAQQGAVDKDALSH